MLLNNIPYLEELDLMHQVEYLYYADLINYIVESDKSENAMRLLKKSRAHFECIRNKYEILENFEKIRIELELYYTNNMLDGKDVEIKSIVVESTDYSFENGKTYRTKEGQTRKYPNVYDPTKFKADVSSINLMSLL